MFLSPSGARASFNATLQASVAATHLSNGRPNYAFALSVVCAVVAAALVLLALLGPERRDVRFVE